MHFFFVPLTTYLFEKHFHAPDYKKYIYIYKIYKYYKDFCDPACVFLVRD